MRLIRFDEVVEGFGGSVGYLRDVPVGDLGGPAGDGTSELVDLGWAGFVLEVVCELEGVLESEGGAVDLVDASHGFLRVPGCAHFAVGVTSVEESAQACLTAVADPLMRGGEEPAYPIEWVSFPASVSEGFVLDSSSYFVETLVGEADDVERVCYLEGVGQHPVIRLPVRTGHVQYRPADTPKPIRRL